MELFVNVFYHLKNDDADGFIEAIEASGAGRAVRAEDGCLRYDYFKSAADPKTVVLLERWESAEKQAVHLTQPHMADIRRIKEEFCESTEAFMLEEKK